MIFEQPSLVPPDDLQLERSDGQPSRPVGSCQLIAHNVAPDGKADPISLDDPHFVFLYQHGDVFYQVRGLNPEMMSGWQVSPSEANQLLGMLPYRTS